MWRHILSVVTQTRSLDLDLESSETMCSTLLNEWIKDYFIIGYLTLTILGLSVL